MAHRSRLSQLLVDVPTEVFDQETAFWASVLGREPRPDPGDSDYAEFGQALPGLGFMTQRIGGAARLHVDIESDDVEAEVGRLQALGAQIVDRIHSWVVMRDPAGLLFCVIRVQDQQAFDNDARIWP